MAQPRASKKRNTRSKGRRRSPRKRDAVLVFTKRNYVLLGICVALITLGYVIMRLENEVDGFLSLYISPLVLLAGYLGVIYAIMWRPERNRPTDQKTQS